MCGGLAKGYVLAWVARILGIRGRFLQRILLRTKTETMPQKSATRIRTQASAEIGCARVASRVYWRDAGAALCDMEITLCNCTYVQFFL